MENSMSSVVLFVLLCAAWILLKLCYQGLYGDTPNTPANTRAELAILAEERRRLKAAQDLEQRTAPKIQDDSTRAIREGYRSAKYSFLETATPTDTLSYELKQALPFLEQRLLQFKQLWLSTPYPRRLATTVDQIIKDRKGKPITLALCLAVGGKNEIHDVQRFLIFSQIVAQLSIAWPELLGNIVVQDPKMTAEWKALFRNHGCLVVRTPAAFQFVGSDTFLFSAFCNLSNFVEGLKDRPVRELAIFVGNGDGMRSTVRDLGDSNPEYKKVLSPVFDDGFCNEDELLCYRCEDKSAQQGPMGGLRGIDIWWREDLTEDEKLQIRFNAACHAEFEGDIEEFEQAYDAGFADRYSMFEQEYMVRGFIASNFHGNPQTFAEYSRAYAAGELLIDEKYEKEIKRWLTFRLGANGYRQQQRSLKAYLRHKKEDQRPWHLDLA